MLEDTLAIVLAGGVGSRLDPLTRERAKPAVPFGGKYRIIDFSLSNCLHSGLRRVLVLTQYKSHSLQKHLRDGWSIFNPEIGEYITPVPPQMRTGTSWYRGTADAIHQNLYLIERSGARWVLVLAGDHVYRMDYAPMLEFHTGHGGDTTVACMKVPLGDASQFGVMRLDSGGRIEAFEEKPPAPEPLPDDPDHVLASMGVYVFSTNVLLDAVRRDVERTGSSHDFGRDIIPALIRRGGVFGYRFGGDTGRVTPDRYWRDVGTIDAYYRANMDLLEPVPPLDLYQTDWPIRTYPGQFPPARTAPGRGGRDGVFSNSIVSSGTVIAGGSVRGSILFNNVVVGDGAMVEGSLLFEGVSVGADARLKNCIVDKSVRIPPGERIGVDLDRDRQRFVLSAGNVVVVAKGYRFADERG